MFSSYHYAPQWLPHERNWLMLPSLQSSWDRDFIHVQKSIIELANIIVQFEPVAVLHDYTDTRHLIANLDSRVELLPWSEPEWWINDNAPMVLLKKNMLTAKIAAIFWGERNTTSIQSNCCYSLVKKLYIPIKTQPLLLNSNMYTADGAGTIVLDKNAVFNNTKNAALPVKTINSALERFGRHHNVVWLDYKPLVNSHNHLADIMIFIAEGKVLLATSAYTSDVNASVYASVLIQIKNIIDGFGQYLSVYTVGNPLPTRYQNRKVTISYANLLLVHKAVVMPKFGHQILDAKALSTVKGVFPSRDVIQFNALPLARAGGGLRAVVWQQPNTSVLRWRMTNR